MRISSRCVFGLVGVIGFSAPALATDLAVAPPSSWSGFYVGPQGGWGWGHSAAQFVNGTSGALSLDAQGAFVGLVGGVNWQMNSFLLGVEGDLSAAHLIQTGTGTAPPNTSHIDLTVDTLADIRARLGWLPNEDWLFYVAGGAAFVHSSRLQVYGSGVSGGPSAILATQTVGNWQTGWTVGVGVEHALGDNWTGRLEYDYAQFSSVKFPLTFTPGGAGTNASLSLQTIKFALVKHLGGGQVGSLASTDVPFHWSGFYAGLNAGYGTGTSTAAFASGAPGALSLSAQGATAGGQIGFNWQNGKLLLGVEGDYDATRISQDGTGLTPPNVSHVDLTVDQLASIRGRVGWIPNNDWLFYGTAGVAFAHANRLQVYDPLPATIGGALTTQLTSNWHTGWTVGLGAERAIGHNWSAKLEYTYASYDTKNYPLTFTPGGAGTNGNLTMHLIKFGLNKHF